MQRQTFKCLYENIPLEKAKITIVRVNSWQKLSLITLICLASVLFTILETLKSRVGKSFKSTRCIIINFLTFWVITFELDKIQKRKIPQNERLNVINLEFPCNFLLKRLEVGLNWQLNLYDARFSELSLLKSLYARASHSKN